MDPDDEKPNKNLKKKTLITLFFHFQSIVPFNNCQKDEDIFVQQAKNVLNS